MAMRTYKVNGYKLPSVTTITGQLDKPALTYWAANCACDYIIDALEDMWPHLKDGIKQPIIGPIELSNIIESARKNFRTVSAKALDIGSAVHKAIEIYLREGKEPQAPSDQVLSAFVAFLEWQDANQMIPIDVERTVYSRYYAGTCDLICELNGRKYLVDFKSSKGIYDEMKYQVAAYRATDFSIEGCGILRLDKETGEPEWVDTSSTYENDLNIFDHLCEIWWLTHPNYKRPK